jgi:hypothetical protein
MSRSQSLYAIDDGRCVRLAGGTHLALRGAETILINGNITAASNPRERPAGPGKPCQACVFIINEILIIPAVPCFVIGGAGDTTALLPSGVILALRNLSAAPDSFDGRSADLRRRSYGDEE